MAVLAIALPPAKADVLYVGSQDGECCFNVALTQITSTEVQVEVTVTDGALYFVDTGSGQHPGFGFNITGDPSITISGLSSPWTSTDAHTTSVTTGGPSLGTFDYFIDNPGPGSSKHNGGPLIFDVSVSSGTLSVNDFTDNASGYYFVSDIYGSDGNTGLSGINVPGTSTVPEPSSLLWLLPALAAIGGKRAWLKRPA